MVAAAPKPVTTASPQYYEGFRAAVGGGKAGSEALIAAEVPATLVETTPDPAHPSPVAAFPWEERIKKEMHPLDAFSRLLECAANNQPPGEEDRFRFQWFGLFYQGPEQDAFLLRLRLPGGRLRTYQLAGLAVLSQELAGGCVVCNAQGGLDLPGILVRDSMEALRRVEEIGLRSMMSGGDCVRAVCGGEYENLANHFSPPLIYPLVRELEHALAMERRLADLPTGCEVRVCACDETPPQNEAEGGALIFRAASARPENPLGPDSGVPRFVMFVPGFGSVGVTLTAAQVVPACLELLDRWAAQGERSDRRNAGIAAFCKGAGEGRLREWLAQRNGPLATAPPDNFTNSLLPAARPVGVEVPAGCLLSGALERLSEVVQRHGADELRLAGGQLFVPCAADNEAAADALRTALNPI